MTKSATAPRPKRARTSEISKATLDDTKVNESVSQGSHIADQFVVDSNDVSVVANEAQLREPADVVILPALAGAGHVNNMLMAPQVPLMAAYNPPVAWNGVLPIAMQQPAAAPGFHQFQLQPQMVAGPQLFVVNGHQEQRNIFRPPPYENQFYPHPGGGAMYGSAPVWATKRQQLCEALPYYKAYQSGSYTSEGILYAMMIDKERRDTDVLNEEVIITRWYVIFKDRTSNISLTFNTVEVAVALTRLLTVARKCAIRPQVLLDSRS